MESFIKCLFEIAEHCDFKEKSERIRNQIVIDILDHEVSEKLQLRSKLTLDETLQLVRQTETKNSNKE